jgi:uncharacterized protein with HEPN domain
MKRNLIPYLKDILNNLELAAEFTLSMSYEEFCKDAKTVYAVIRCLEVMGEAAKNIPTATRRKYPDIRWKKWRECGISSFMGIPGLILIKSG